MESYFGIVCGDCNTYSQIGTRNCPECGNDLTAELSNTGGAAPAAKPSREELMEQARNYICKECSSPVPSGHKFCGACGAKVPEDIQLLREEYFGAMQSPGKARLILIRGDQGVDGLSYLLQGNEHVAGRQNVQILFPDDSWLSPRHANFIYRGEKLVVRDEGSVNGVYVRLTAPMHLRPGDRFLCGEQVFRLDEAPEDTAGPA
ncbi:MAG: zinc ribbon domain-containing protein [Myxococcota bacterium]